MIIVGTVLSIWSMPGGVGSGDCSMPWLPPAVGSSCAPPEGAENTTPVAVTPQPMRLRRSSGEVSSIAEANEDNPLLLDAQDETAVSTRAPPTTEGRERAEA